MWSKTSLLYPLTYSTTPAFCFLWQARKIEKSFLQQVLIFFLGRETAKPVLTLTVAVFCSLLLGSSTQEGIKWSKWRLPLFTMATVVHVKNCHKLVPNVYSGTYISNNLSFTFHQIQCWFIIQCVQGKMNDDFVVQVYDEFRLYRCPFYKFSSFTSFYSPQHTI